MSHIKTGCTAAIWAFLPFISSAFAEPAISEFHGETKPGIVTQMDLHWTLKGEAPEGMVFRITRIETSEGLQVESHDIVPGTQRQFTDIIEPGRLTVPYRIEAVVGDSIIASAETEGIVAYRGGVASLQAQDAPYDGGGVIDVTWRLMDNLQDVNAVHIYRNRQDQDAWELAGVADPADGSFSDSGLEDKIPYNYMLRVYAGGRIMESKPLLNIVSHAAWFNFRKINLMVIAFIVLSAVTYYVLMSGRRGRMFIRKISGLHAVEEAVGRATEMGRSVLFIPGIQDMDDVQTIAGLTILGSVAKLTAQYETKLDVPVPRSLVMSTGREVVKEAFLSVGRPDLYHDDIVHYVTDEQFGYVAAVDGIMVREQPAACFYMGAFFAESLILAETGNSVGAIQIAGTAMPTQLPFFVAACDYTLIGEELFAASAYLSQDNRMIASLRGQDVGKGMAMLAIALGSVQVTISSITGDGFWMNLSDAFVRLFALNF